MMLDNITPQIQSQTNASLTVHTMLDSRTPQVQSQSGASESVSTYRLMPQALHYGNPHESYSILSSLMTMVEYERGHKTSIYGPTNRTQFLLIIGLMTFCGSNNDFLGKLCYQSLPGQYVGLELLEKRYWIAWLLTMSTFLICSCALLFGWDGGKQWTKFKRYKCLFLTNIFYAATCDVVVNLGRYIGLVFLAASVVSLLKNGLQLLFSALFRIIFEKKTLSLVQTIGIVLVITGLGLVCWCSFLDASITAATNTESTLTGIATLIVVGFCGSIRNSFEQILCRDKGFNCNFVVGMRSIVSLLWTFVIAIILLSVSQSWSWDKMYENGIRSISGYTMFWVGLVLFMLAIYGKNVTQMKVIEMSSALTRNLTMQFTPVFTWILSLMFYYGLKHENLGIGEPWTQYSVIRLIGFIMVLVGACMYMRLPTDDA
eukprot:692899_1